MDLDDDDDEVVAEYPLYAVSITDLNSQAADIRLAQLQYPLRPEWRGYGIENATEVTYKPVHRVLTATVPEDELSKKKGGRVHLSGRGRVPEAPLCALCKVDGAFVLMAIDELTSLRPEMSKFVQDEAARKAEEEGKAADGDYKPKKEAAAARKNGDDAAASDSKATLSTVKVEVKKRENERQRSMRERSHTHLREQIEAEEAKPLKPHGLDEGAPTLRSACQQLVQKFPAEVAMGVPAAEYLRLVSPAHQVAPRVATAAEPQTPAQEAPAKLDKDSLVAVKQALESLFQEQSVVTMPDVRVWLASYTAAPKAQQAARLRDDALATLLLGGGSILCIRGRFVLKPEEEPFRELVLELLQASKGGVRRADVMKAATAQGLSVKEHEYGKVLRDLCVAKGATWELKEGASFQSLGK